MTYDALITHLMKSLDAARPDGIRITGTIGHGKSHAVEDLDFDSDQRLPDASPRKVGAKSVEGDSGSVEEPTR